MPILLYTTRIAANRPNSAPDAPYAAVIHPDGEHTAHTISPAPPPNPDSRYSARYGQCPIMRSSTGPTHHKVSMLNRMCHSEVGWCRNIEVMKVHGCRTAVAGSSMPAFTNALPPSGQTRKRTASMVHTTMQIAMMAVVMTGSPLRHRYRSDRAENRSLNDGESGNRLNRWYAIAQHYRHMRYFPARKSTQSTHSTN